MAEHEIQLYCDSVICLKANGKSLGGGARVLKKTIKEADFKPTTHKCEYCRGMLTPKRRRMPPTANRLGPGYNANNLTGKRIHERHY